MTDIDAIEGTREELQEMLRSYPKQQRFLLVPLLQSQSVSGHDSEEQSLSQLFAGRVGHFHFADSNLSTNSGGKFTALMDEKKRQGRL